MRLILPRKRPILLRLQPRTEGSALYLLGICVLDIGDPLAYLCERVTITKPTRVQDRVDGEIDALQGCEQQLGTGAGELWGVGERTDRQHRLERPNALTVQRVVSARAR